jgi:hypothetical protein
LEFTLQFLKRWKIKTGLDIGQALPCVVASLREYIQTFCKGGAPGTPLQERPENQALASNTSPAQL